MRLYEEALKETRSEYSEIIFKDETEKLSILRDYKMETYQMELRQTQQINDLWISGAADLGRELRNGGEDLLGLAVKIGLEFAKIKLGESALGGFGGPIFGFLGGLL